MRILKNAVLQARWKDEWDRVVSGFSRSLWSLGQGSESSGFGGEREFLYAVKTALADAKRLEAEGAFRVLVRWSAAGEAVTRSFRRDETHPKTPDDMDASEDAVLFVDTRRIDGARRR